MTDFGRVGRIRGADGTDAVFMVVAPSDRQELRNWVPDYRWVVNLSGVGYVGGKPVLPGEMGPVRIANKDIKWLR